MAPVSAGGESQTTATSAATAGFFRALGIQPARGRAIEPPDERAGAPPVVVVSHTFAVARLGGDASALGRSILIDGRAHTVVGVLSAGVKTLGGRLSDLWPALQLETPQRRGPFGLY